MKKVFIVLLLFSSFACKKNKKQACHWDAVTGSDIIHTWYRTEPTDIQIQDLKESCACTFEIKKTCIPCDGASVTDPNGNDICE